MKKINTKVNLDPDLLLWLAEEAARRRCSISQVVRDLVVAEMERRRNPDVRPS